MDTPAAQSADEHIQQPKGRSLPLYESRFRKLIESDLMGIAIPDRFGAFIEANDELLRITGYTRADLDAGLVRWDVMTPPEYAELDRAHIAEAAQRGNCTPYEKEYIRKDGTRVPIMCGYALLEGTQDEYIGFVQDLTPQKHAEAALRSSEEQFRILAESLPQFIWAFDLEGERKYCNRKFLEYAGFDSIQQMFSEWQTLLHPEDRPAALAAWEHSLRTGDTYSREERLRRHDGVYRHQLSRAAPVRNEAGHIKLWMGSITDIHDQKQNDEALRRTEKLAATGRLAASIAHEINNPLTSVTNAIYLALQDQSLSPTTREYLTLADQELARAAHVVTHTLRFHKQSSQPTLVDLGDLMNSALSIYARRFETFAITIQREYQTTRKFSCRADELRQAFAHILSNSLDAMHHGGCQRIRIRDARSFDASRTPGIKIVIADTGDGIPAHLLPRVFEAFTSTKQATGTGLGLWVVDGIIRQHNGRIALRSRTGHGTVLSLFFPD